MDNIKKYLEIVLGSEIVDYEIELGEKINIKIQPQKKLEFISFNFTSLKERILRADNKKNITYIYTLVDPRNNQVKYVGKSVNPEMRLRGHIGESKSIYQKFPKNVWIRKLQNEGLEPVMEIVDEVSNEESNYWELFWTQTMVVWGFQLLNTEFYGNNRLWTMKVRKCDKSVLQYDMEGNFITKHKNLKIASEKRSCRIENIRNCCAGRTKSSGGYVWKYEKI